MAKYFGGIQGGGSVSDAVIVDETGQVVGGAHGSGTNPNEGLGTRLAGYNRPFVWEDMVVRQNHIPCCNSFPQQIGFEKCVSILSDLISRAKKEASLNPSMPLESLGMSLSGGEVVESQERIITDLKKKHPETSKSYIVCTDTFGSIATAFSGGGMVLISGTGSNCQLLNPPNSSFPRSPRCGGWGHMLGDEGSAYWVSHRAIKIVYDHEDGMSQSPHDITAIKRLIVDKFKLQDRFDIIPHLYGKFEKAKMALLCKDLAILAKEKNDMLALHLFRQAGFQLGKHVKALLPNAEPSLLVQPGGLHIVAVGSVLTKSWDLLREGFIEALQDRKVEFTLVALKEGVSSAVGAAALGAEEAGLSLSVDYAANTHQLFHYKPE